MSTTTGPLTRDTRHAWVAGVLAGIGDRIGIDPIVLRVAFVIGAIATGGLLLLAYLIAWAALPAAEGGSAPMARFGRIARVRGDWRVAVGAGLLTLSALLAFRQLGIWWSDPIAWPLALAAFGVALLWIRSPRRATPSAEPSPDVSARAPRPGPPPRRLGSKLAEEYSGAFGVLLVVGAGLLFLSSNHVLGGLRDAALTAVVVIVALGLILAPFLWRLGRNLAAERAERIRSEERAQVAAHLHDSVLQTLTLMQKRADDPREVASLARRQERELRDWLAGGGRRDNGDRSLASELRTAAEAIEDDHRVAIESIVVGDCELDERAEAVLGAAREALLNAAKHSGDSGPIRVYAEIDDAGIALFVRDRGAGFDLDAVAEDRRGVRESIVRRMERAGGHADIRSSPGGGTEVAIEIARENAAAKGTA
jgi:signal transduction histidine kinase